MTLNDQLNYGVQFYLASHCRHAIGRFRARRQCTLERHFAGNSVGPPLTGSQCSRGQRRRRRASIINALHQLTDVKILSNPSLVVVDNERGDAEVGDQVPITTGSATVLSANNAVVNTVDYKNTGIILHVQPQVNSNGTVLLEHRPGDQQRPGEQHQSDADDFAAQGQERDLGHQRTDGAAGRPRSATAGQNPGGHAGAHQFPVSAAAFGTTGATDQRTELIILIRPQIIRDGVDASMVAEELRSKMRGGRIERRFQLAGGAQGRRDARGQ